MSLPKGATRTGRTPYDDDYPTCERTSASLRIYGDQLDPASITNQLGIDPSQSQAVGETFTNSLGYQRVAKVGAWILSSESHVASRDLRSHLDWLLGILLERKDKLVSLRETPGFWLNVSCVWWSRHGDGGPILWPEHMQKLADLNLECGFELSFFDEP